MGINHFSIFLPLHEHQIENGALEQVEQTCLRWEYPISKA